MVWFQCEDCGDQLKKPKLPNHFRVCSAYKFSCIDCGEVFDQERVQGHTQCITEAEKYGPKGQVKPSNGKQNKDQKQQKPDFDVNVGLSDRPPWFCSLCNTKATSKQTLLLHAEGKKHRAKAKAFHASQQPKPSEESNPDIKNQTEDNKNTEMTDTRDIKEKKQQDAPKVHAEQNNAGSENGSVHSKKRKADADFVVKKKSDVSGEVGNGEVIQAEREEAEEKEKTAKKAKSNEHGEDKKEDTKAKIRWKKLITSALKSNPDGVLKKKKLKKLVLKSLKESGITQDDVQLDDILEQKITSSSRFTVDKKYVRLVSKE